MKIFQKTISLTITFALISQNLVGCGFKQSVYRIQQNSPENSSGESDASPQIPTDRDGNVTLPPADGNEGRPSDQNDSREAETDVQSADGEQSAAATSFSTSAMGPLADNTSTDISENTLPGSVLSFKAGDIVVSGKYVGTKQNFTDQNGTFWKSYVVLKDAGYHAGDRTLLDFESDISNGISGQGLMQHLKDFYTATPEFKFDMSKIFHIDGWLELL